MSKPVLPTINRCRDCDRPIRWIRILPSRKRHPIDAAAVGDGTIEIALGKGGEIWWGRVLTRAQRANYVGRLFMSHFATCPFSEQRRAR